MPEWQRPGRATNFTTFLRDFPAVNHRKMVVEWDLIVIYRGSNGELVILNPSILVVHSRLIVFDSGYWDVNGYQLISMDIPPGKRLQTPMGNSTLLLGNLTISTGRCSIAMLNHQRVNRRKGYVNSARLTYSLSLYDIVLQ